MKGRDQPTQKHGKNKRLPRVLKTIRTPRSLIALSLLLFLPIILLTVGVPASFQQRAATSSLPPIQHVFLIIFENKDYQQMLGNASAPYFNQLVKQGALAANYHALMHPSLPNYILINSGSNQGITTDCPVSQCGNLSSDNLAHQLLGAGKTWKAYMEGMTTNCQTTDSGEYAQKHNPFAYFADLSSSCLSNDVPYTQLQTDLQSGNLANYIWITPNLINDMHDGTIQNGDTWLSNNLPPILHSNAYKQNGLVIITFDEDSNTGGNNQISTLFLSPLAKQGYQSTAAYNHDSLLRTLEDIFGLPPLGSAVNASPMADLFTATTSNQPSAVSTTPTLPVTTPLWYCGGSQNCVTGVPTPTSGGTSPATISGTLPQLSSIPSGVPSVALPTGLNPPSGKQIQGELQGLLIAFLSLIEGLLRFLAAIFRW